MCEIVRYACRRYDFVRRYGGAVSRTRSPGLFGTRSNVMAWHHQWSVLPPRVTVYSSHIDTRPPSPALAHCTRVTYRRTVRRSTPTFFQTFVATMVMQRIMYTRSRHIPTHAYMKTFIMTCREKKKNQDVIVTSKCCLYNREKNLIKHSFQSIFMSGK